MFPLAVDAAVLDEVADLAVLELDGVPALAAFGAQVSWAPVDCNATHAATEKKTRGIQRMVGLWWPVQHCFGLGLSAAVSQWSSK